MARAFLTISFLLLFIWWLRQEFPRRVSFRQHLRWLIAAILVQMIASLLSLIISNRVVGNFFYHAVGGGVTTALIYEYFLKTYKLRLSWRVELVLLYAFVSSLGVLNELAEYAGEFVTRVGMFSWDSHDTWRDLTANTLGAISAWLVYKLAMYLTEKKHH